MKNRDIIPRPLSVRALTAAFLIIVSLLFSFFAAASPGTAQEPLQPPAKSDASSAFPIYSNRCANCHGPQGRGDGELTGNLAAPPRDYSDPQFLNEAVPSSMFQTITQGRLEAGMPPFGPSSSNPIDTSDRWDLVALVYSLGTPVDSIENGQSLYDQNCASCHGQEGMGNGPQAAESTNPIPDLTELSYWTNRSNNVVAAALQDDDVEDHSYQLSDEQISDVVHFARTFSYDRYDPVAALEPIEAATISGQIINQTTGDLVTEGEVNLRGFTRSFEESLSLTTPLNPDGSYTFDLEDLPPDLVYLTSIQYEGLTFNSDPAQLELSEALTEMPITVFDKTSDPQAISIEQIHLVFEFLDDRLFVNEIYVLNNNEPAVFVGESGIPAEGTIEIGLPQGAERVGFQRSFDSFGNFMAATEMIQTDQGWADTIPLRPGQSAMNLLVTYDLPYENGLDFSHPLFYDASRATVVMPDSGVSLEGTDWNDQGVQQMGEAGTFNSYGRSAVSAGSSLSFELQGRASRTSNAAATTSVENGLLADSTTSLLIGVAVLVLVVVGGVFTVRSWQSTTPVAAQHIEPDEREELLLAIADLDEKFESGKIKEADYDEQRESLMSELLTVWQQ